MPARKTSSGSSVPALTLLLLIGSFGLAPAEDGPTDPDNELAGSGFEAVSELDQPPPGCDPQRLSSGEMRIGEIKIVNGDIFDTSDPAENRKLFRAANKLHLATRPEVIRRQLLFRTGDPYDSRLLLESERVLRRAEYLYDASVRAVRCEADRVDVEVRTRDVWTLQGGIGFGRSGGTNTVRTGLEDQNFLGTGKDVAIKFESNVDRRSYLYRYRDPNILGSRTRMSLVYQDNSDGSVKQVDVSRPFYALETRHAGGGLTLDNDRFDRLYDRGEVIDEFRHRTKTVRLFAGFSRGLVGGSVRRWVGGYTYEQERFQPTTSTVGPVPVDRTLSYPFLRFEWIEDGYVRAYDLDRIRRTEDLNLGREFRAELGWSSKRFGAWRDEAIFNLGYRAGYRPGSGLLLVSAHAEGRWHDSPENFVTGGELRYFRRFSPRRTIYADLMADLARRLDGENQLQLGGDNGLRGYPLRYATGDRRFLVRVEHRWYTRLDLLRLLHVGAAAFVDVGQAWFAHGGAEDQAGLLRDVGIGLRLSSSRSKGGSMVHVDVAFPLDGDPSIDRVQFLVETKENF